MKKTIPACLSRVGALGLVAATVVTGLTLSPVGTASAQPAQGSSPTSSAAPGAPSPIAGNGTPVDVSGSTPVDIADEAPAVPAVEITSSTSYTDAEGGTVYRFEGTRVAGASVRYGVGAGWFTGNQTFPSSTTFILETSATPGDWFQFIQTSGGVESPVTSVSVSTIVARLPHVTVTRSTSYVDAAGRAVHRHEGTGVVGATVQYGPSNKSYALGMTIGADGKFAFETTTVPTGSAVMDIRQQLGQQASPKVQVANDDLIAELPRVVVTSSTVHTDAAGRTVHRHEGTGVAGATIQFGPTGTEPTDGMTVGSDGRFIVQTSALPVGDQAMELRQTLAEQTSPTIEIANSAVTSGLPRLVVTKATSYTNADGETVHRFEGTGVPGAAVRDSRDGDDWRDSDTVVGDDHHFAHETTDVAPSPGAPAWLSQRLGEHASAGATVDVGDVTAELPVVSVDKATWHTNAEGQTVHRYEGTGVVGAIVQFGGRYSSWADGPIVGTDGTFSFETTRVPGPGGVMEFRHKLGTQHSTRIQIPVSDVTAEFPFAMTSPSASDTFTPGTAVFEGTGTAGSTITLTPQRGLSAVTATVDDTGHWTARKSLGNGTYVFDITQTSPTGQAQGVINAFIYAPTGSSVERNFEMITPRVGDSFTPDSFVHFVGQGTPGATITLKPQAGLSEATATVGADGFWKIRRGMGNGTYIFSVTQTIDGVVTGKPIVGFVYGPTVDGDPITRPFAVTSHASGDTFPANTTVAISGTGTPNATVTLKPQGNLSERTVPVSRDGYWVAPRAMGNGAYTFTITQMLEGNVVGTPITDFVLTPAQ